MLSKAQGMVFSLSVCHFLVDIFIFLLIARKVLILLGVSVIQKASASERYGEPSPYDESNINTSNKPTVQKSPGELSVN